MSPMGRGLSHWWRRMVYGGLMEWVTFENSISELVMPGLVPGIHVFGITLCSFQPPGVQAGDHLHKARS